MEKQLEELEKKVKEAQEKLSDIMTAINREKLVKEEAIKENETLKEEVSKKTDEVAKVSKNIETLVEKLEIKKADTDRELKDLDGAVSDAKELLESLRSDISKANEELLRVKSDIFHVVNEGKEISLEAEKKLKEKILALEEAKNLLDAEVSKLSQSEILALDRKSMLEKEFDNLNEEIHKKQVELAQTIEAYKIGIEEKERVSEEVVLERAKLTELRDLVIAKKVEADEAVVATEKVKAELAALETEKGDFIKAKIALLKEKEDLQNREEFIREKYQLAGIKF